MDSYYNPKGELVTAQVARKALLRLADEAAALGMVAPASIIQRNWQAVAARTALWARIAYDVDHAINQKVLRTEGLRHA